MKSFIKFFGDVLFYYVMLPIMACAMIFNEIGRILGLFLPSDD